MDGSGRAQEKSLNSSCRSSVPGSRWRPSSHAFKEYPSSTCRPSPDQRQFCRTGRPPRLVVDRSLVVKLTKDIIETYQSCNSTFTYTKACNPKRFLTNPSVPGSNDGRDNENFDLILAVNGELVNGDSSHRYIVKDLLGQGTFGQVAKCWSDERKCFVAVKVIKNQPAYYQQALVEITILNMLNDDFDPEDKHHIVRILEHFVYHGHLCIVFELLGVNLFELLKVNFFKGISLNLIRLFTKQILTALAVLRDAGVIHCDLKPENILLTTRPAAAELKLIDFGSACREFRTVYSYIQSRFYRSPEVVLGHEYTTAIDMWSFGCIAAELFLGLPLFPALSQYDLLQRMIEILGDQPPDYILRNSKNANKYFKRAGVPARHNGCTGEGQHSVYQFLNLDEYEMREKERPAIGKHYNVGSLEQIITSYHMKKRMSPEDMERESNRRFVFIHFLKGLVNFDPSKRWTPRQAAQHPFVTEEPFTGSFQPPAETPRPPIHQGMTIDHNPVSGHWIWAGFSPKVSTNPILPYGSPFSGPPFSCASSYGSAGSYGSFGDGAGLGSSYGSYGDGVASYMNPQTPLGVGNTSFGNSPDTWRRMGHLPPSALGQAHVGLSPSTGPSIPMSLGASPSNFTPPGSHFQPSPGSSSTTSPSRYGPPSPARSSGASSLGKAAAFGQYKRRSWGSPGSVLSATGGNRSSGQDNLVPWHSAYQNTYTGNADTSFYIESTPQSSNVGSPRNSSIQGSHQSPQIRQRTGIVGGATAGQGQNYPIGSLGALISKTPPTSEVVEDTSPPPNPGDWDPNYSEEQFLQNDGGDTVSTYVSTVPSPSEAAGSGVTPEPSPFNTPPVLGLDSSGRVNHNTHLQGGAQTMVLRSNGMMPLYMEGGAQSMQGYVSKFLHYGHHSQQISPSRLGQQPAQLLQQHMQYQYHQPLNLHDHLPTQQKLNNRFQGQIWQAPDQPLLYHTAANNFSQTGGHALLPTVKRDGRVEHVPMPPGGNFDLHVSYDPFSLANGYPGALGVYESSPGMHAHEHLNFIPESGSHWVAGILSHKPIAESYSGQRMGGSNGAVPPNPSSKDRRMDS